MCADPIMEHPSNDIEDRKPIWDAMQMFWMDTDPSLFLDSTAEVCSKSKYSIEELSLIYWNEVRPAVSFNMLLFPAPEWAGFEINWLIERILKKHKYGRRLPIFRLHPYSNSWWNKLKRKIQENN